VLSLYENSNYVVVTGLSNEIDVLVEEFRFRPNGYFYAPSYERWKVSEGREGWDGWIRPFERLDATAGKILRGRRNEILTIAELNSFDVDTRKLLPRPYAGITIEDIAPNLIEGSFELDDRQRACILQWLREGIGINRVTVGGGKTAMFAGAAAFIKHKYPTARFLYVTQAERLVRQVTREMKKFLPGFDIGQFGGGVYDEDAKDMVVCTVAMLNKHYNRLNSSKWFRSFLCVMYDEVHHASSKTSKRVMLATAAYFRLGASDSIKADDPVRSAAIHGLFGPVLEDIGAAPLIDAGRLAVPHIYVVEMPKWRNLFQNTTHAPYAHSKAFVLSNGEWVPGKYLGPVFERDADGEIVMREVKGTELDDLGEWKKEVKPVQIQGLHRIEIDGEETEVDSRWCLLDRAYDKAIIQFGPRNDLIVEWAKHYSDRKLPTLVVCTRTLHIYILEALLKDAIDPELVDILFGYDTPATRDEKFEWFRTTPGSVLVTPLVKEGISINEIRAGVIADYVGDWEVANQIIGRFIRSKQEDNRAEITWFKDVQYPVYRRGFDRIFTRLRDIEGYQFYPNCSGPASVQRMLPLKRADAGRTTRQRRP